MLFKLLRFHSFIYLLSFSLLKTAVASDLKAEDEIALKGSFTQSKTIKPLKRPFKSSGQFIYLPNKGLLWQTLKPVQSAKLFAHNGLFNIDESGKINKEASLDNAFFLSLFSGDEQALKAYFDVLDADTDTYTSVDTNTKNEHCIALRPKSSTLQTLFVQIELCRINKDHKDDHQKDHEKGSQLTDLPSSITLQEHKGNSTVIKLDVSSDLVNEKELGLFELTP